ncbi:MAG: DUF362 domain-containing protein [Candidatus Omnitrophota bacterium]
MQNHSETRSKVYLKRIDDWTSEAEINKALLSIWQKIDTDGLIKKDDFLGIKLTFGEEGTSGYIKSNWLQGLISSLRQKTENLFIIETNTLYREKRSNAVGHLHVAHAHGYGIEQVGIPVIIADGLHGRNSHNINIAAEHFENVKLAKAVCETDFLLSLSHVTGHCQIGLAATLKNLGMGCAARVGKLAQHSRTLPEITTAKCIGCGACMKICPANAIGIKKKKAILVKERCIGCGECAIICKSGGVEIKYDENVVKLQEKMVEYALGVKNALNSRLACMNLLYNVTKNCDCMSNAEPSIAPDIGVVGSVDPVAIDKAALDLIGKQAFERIYPEIDLEAQIRYAEKIKLGSSDYEIIEI